MWILHNVEKLQLLVAYFVSVFCYVTVLSFGYVDNVQTQFPLAVLLHKCILNYALERPFPEFHMLPVSDVLGRAFARGCPVESL